MIWLLTQPPENHSLGIDAASSEATLKTIFCWSPFVGHLRLRTASIH